jgi:hypothetical protein
MRKGGPLSLLLFSIDFEVLQRAIRKEEEMRDIQIWKQEVKLCTSAHDMIL